MTSIPRLLSAICGLSLLLSGCASEPSEFEKQNRWLEKNYPKTSTSKKNKSKTNRKDKTQENIPSP